jgi:Zn-dependent peptidase ImmA (M78 family)
MGLELFPETKMARRLHKKHSLSIPVDLNKLISEYAEILYKNIPITGIDGVCINLKNPNKSTRVIVNNNSSKNRQRFTLAHELGHIIIPWHLGTIIDNIDNNLTNIDNQYWLNEREANNFASELLMPFDWLYSEYIKLYDFETLVYITCDKCLVSEDAARIRIRKFKLEFLNYELSSSLIHKEYKEHKKLNIVQEVLTERSSINPLYVARQMCQNLNGKIAFCIEEDGIVIECGSTHNTHALYQFEGDEFIRNPYPHYKQYSTYKHDGIVTHWWDLDVSFHASKDSRSWQEILSKIANDLDPEEGITKFKNSINGTLSGVNGSWKKKYPERSVEEFINEILQRFNNINSMSILNHPDFAIFVRKRGMELYGRI